MGTRELMMALAKTFYLICTIGWLAFAALPFFGITFNPIIVSLLCVNMALTFARWAVEI